MPSMDAGKDYVCGWVRDHFRRDASILDVGACDGKWRRLLSEYPNMDAVEVWAPSARLITRLYRRLFRTDIRDFTYDEDYDLIIFGDVIEHLGVEDAQAVLRTAAKHCEDMIVCVPWLWPQGPAYGNPYEIHIQDDLTPEVFAERYPDLEVLHDPLSRICYYHKRAEA